MYGTILLMDNKEEVLQKWGDFLEADGFGVTRAASLEEAERVLENEWIHLAILDIRMVDEDDENDISGLLLAQKPEFDLIPKIMLTSFASFEYVRMALAPRAERQTAAINFVVKAEGPQALREAIKRAFVQHVCINWDLQIQWNPQQGLSFLNLAGLLHLNLSSDLVLQRANELQDLFRRLYYDAHQIRIDQLLWHNSRRFCLSVLTQSHEEVTNAQILVCGERDSLRQELKQQKEFAPDIGQQVQLANTAETIHFAAITYALPGADLDTVQPLRNLVESAKRRPLTAAFEHLLGEVLPAWHQRGQRLENSHDLLALYRQRVGLGEDGIAQEEVESRVDALVQAVRTLSAVEVERDDQSLTFCFPQQPPLICPDPVTAAYSTWKQQTAPVVCRVSPGRLTADNVLVDADQKTWLTDFADAGQAPQWWDFVCLEAALRFDLGQAPDLLAWQELEECLTIASGLHEKLSEQDVIPDLQTNVALIEQIRRQAGSETGSDVLPYYAGLLVWTVGAMARYDPAVLHTHAEQMRGAHLLLAAGMLAQRLDETPPPTLPGGPLRLDNDGSVWLGDLRADILMGHELELLHCLYQNPGQVVSREMIVESVFGEEYEGDKHQEGRINSLVRRLRVKVEPNPNRPRYVLTVKGMGYRLQVEGKIGE